MQLAIERRCELQERVDPGRPTAGFEAGDRRLGRPAERGELRLRQIELAAPVCDLRGDRGEEPAAVRAGEPTAEPLDGSLVRV